MDHVSLKTHIAVRMACDELGVSEELAFWSILEYAARNHRAHCDLSDMRDSGKRALLAQTLCADREDLDWTFLEYKLNIDKCFLQQKIQSEINTWFNTSLDAINPDV